MSKMRNSTRVSISSILVLGKKKSFSAFHCLTITRYNSQKFIKLRNSPRTVSIYTYPSTRVQIPDEMSTLVSIGLIFAVRIHSIRPSFANFFVHNGAPIYDEFAFREARNKQNTKLIQAKLRSLRNELVINKDAAEDLYCH